jgi:hypothetical protein
MAQGKFIIFKSFNCLEPLSAINNFNISSSLKKYQRRDFCS